MRSIKIFFLIASLCLFASCNLSEPDTRKITVDGNETLLKIRDGSPQSIIAATKSVKLLLQMQQAQSHAWKTSELSAMNSALAAGLSANISKKNQHLLEISKPLYTASDAYYDPSIGSLVRMWGFYTDKFPISEKSPSTANISEWLASKPNFLDIKVNKGTITASNPKMQLDFSTILEGVAAQDIKNIFARQQIRDAMVVMGSDQFTVGDKDTQPWTVKLKDPFGGDLGQIDLQGSEALFTSGNFNKFRMAPTGSRWGHVLNPSTGKPASGSAAVAVLHSDPVLADVASTALMAAGPGNFHRLVVRMKLACAMMVTEENELLITTQMKKRIKFFRDPVPLGNPIANGESCI
ncbi:MAG: FAD:protein FMN transferase [Arenimonas sp.]